MIKKLYIRRNDFGDYVNVFKKLPITEDDFYDEEYGFCLKDFTSITGISLQKKQGKWFRLVPTTPPKKKR